MFLTSIIAFIVLRKLTIVEANDDAEEADQPPATTDSMSTEATAYSAEHYVLLKRIGNKISQALTIAAQAAHARTINFGAIRFSFQPYSVQC